MLGAGSRIGSSSERCCTGSNKQRVGERRFDVMYLFFKHFNFEDAKEYMKSYGKYLQIRQREDIDVEVVMIL